MKTVRQIKDYRDLAKFKSTHEELHEFDEWFLNGVIYALEWVLEDSDE